MFRLVRFILCGLVLLTVASSLNGCNWPTKPEDKLFNLVVFNTGQDDVRVQLSPADVKGQDGRYVLYHGEGRALFNIKKYPHTLVFTHIYTGQELRRVVIEPNSVINDRSYNGFDGLDCFYDYGNGASANSVVNLDPNLN